MSHGDDGFARAMAAAYRHSMNWLQSLPGRPVGPRAAAHDLTGVFGGALPRTGMPAEEVVEFLARAADPA